MNLPISFWIIERRSMIFLGSIYETIHYTIIFGLIFVFALYINIRALKQYFVKKEITGELVFETKKSPVALWNIGFAAILWILYDTVYFTKDNQAVPPFHLLCGIGIMLMMHWFFFGRNWLPQKIYEKGVLDGTGFVPWSGVSSYRKIGKKENVILLKLYETGVWRARNEIRIECLPGTATSIEEYINEHILNSDGCLK